MNVFVGEKSGVPNSLNSLGINYESDWATEYNVSAYTSKSRKVRGEFTWDTKLMKHFHSYK